MGTEVKTLAYVVAFGSLIIFAIAAIASHSKVTGRKLAVAVGSMFIFFAGWTWLSFIEKGTVGFAPIVLFIWFWVFVFYFFGVRYVSGQGSLRASSLHRLEASPESHAPLLMKALRVSRHILIWPVVALVAFVVVRGLSGKGWVITLSSGPAIWHG